MAKPNVPDLPSLINQQIKLRQDLCESLCKASALLDVSLEGEILQYPKVTIYFYLWSISDLVEQSRELNEDALSELLSQGTQLAEKQATED